MRGALIFGPVMAALVVSGCAQEQVRTPVRPVDPSASCVSGDCDDGIGRAELPGVYSFEGEFRNGLPHHGRYMWVDGDVYEGEFKYGRIFGEGKKTWPDGSSFEGSFRNGDADGDGRHVSANGNIYIGEMRENRPDGHGVFTFGSGSEWFGEKYVGEMRRGKFGGTGTYYYRSGIQYAGGFQDGVQHGVGVIVYPDGLVIRGNWRKGYFVDVIEDDDDQTPDSPGNPITIARAGAVKPPKPDAKAVFGNYGQYHAFVIGNNTYQNFPTLRTARNDAVDVGKVLSTRYGFQVTTLLDATRGEVISKLYEYRKRLDPNDNLLIYYGGHGWYDDSIGKGYWLPVDATEHDPTNWISNATITDTLLGLRAKHVLVVADSCFSGTLVGTRGIDIDMEGPRHLITLSLRHARTALTSGGLEPVEDGTGSNSVFASQFIAALESNDSVLTGQGLFATIREPVMMNADQTPMYAPIRKAGDDGGDFLFVYRPQHEVTSELPLRAASSDHR